MNLSIQSQECPRCDGTGKSGVVHQCTRCTSNFPCVRLPDEKCDYCGGAGYIPNHT